jgi:hypothetical protein
MLSNHLNGNLDFFVNLFINERMSSLIKYFVAPNLINVRGYEGQAYRTRSERAGLIEALSAKT